MKRDIKLIGLDLDGTVLTDDKRITERTRIVLETAAEKGVTVMTATGRPLNAISPEFLSLKGVRYLMASNGAVIYDREQKKIIHRVCLSFEQAREIFRRAEAFDAWKEICIDGVSYTSRESFEKLEEYIPEGPTRKYLLESRVPVDNLPAMISDNRELLEKVCLFFPTTQARDIAKEAFADMEGVSKAGAFSFNYEISNAEATKSKALLKMGETLGLTVNQIMACGDGMNDYEMIKNAGLGVAVANAVDELKAVADFVTDSNEEDGVARAIERFVLNA